MRALVIEDSDEIAECMVDALKDLDIAADRFPEGAQLKAATATVDYDILVLDLNLPDVDGLELLKELRENGFSAPILIVSARIGIQDRVSGLDLGADDYLIKPFALDEFEARVRALLRRDKNTRTPEIVLGNLSFNQSSREFFVHEEALLLSPRERAVLEVLMRQTPNVISKERIAQHVFNFDDHAGTSSIELYVHRLRKRLKDSDVSISTTRGLGYSLHQTSQAAQ